MRSKKKNQLRLPDLTTEYTEPPLVMMTRQTVQSCSPPHMFFRGKLGKEFISRLGTGESDITIDSDLEDKERPFVYTSCYFKTAGV